MKYVDGFVIVVSEKNLPAYRKMAEDAGKIWKKYGALEYIESVGEDLNPDVPAEMKGITFTQMAGARSGETIVFSYILFNSRQHRDEVNARVMKEMEVEMNKPENKDKPMPFDMKRAAYGGFSVIVEA
ncbi:MAG: RNA signal recognition particle [Chloroflexi bacterium RBG_16_57_8]|nr:MAG: RNA signal recognition particle [Chloroflexi bacterium RBG_16_57_8]